MPARITARRESWALKQPFTISRGSKTSAEVILVEIRDAGATGRGECVPYGRYDETPESVMAQIESVIPRLGDDPDRDVLQEMLPPGAARNALDCALWDLEAKQSGKRVWELAGRQPPVPAVCAYTLSLDAPDRMYAAARREGHRPLLKMKVGAEGAFEQVAAVRRGAPDAKLIVDANEAWSLDAVRRLLPEMQGLGVDLIEQPLPAEDDAGLAELDRVVPVAADESCHCARDIPRLIGRYDVVNIKLDKSGGLTEALRLHDQARAAGLGIMVGCMVATSLAMAPATLLAAGAGFVDLDGPLLLAEDRPNGLRYHDGRVAPPEPSLWG